MSEAVNHPAPAVRLTLQGPDCSLSFGNPWSDDGIVLKEMPHPARYTRYTIANHRQAALDFAKACSAKWTRT
ncbi:hypothetical protein, partial [Staphylococcus aureus]|uniref:hypothetical protein n=1 Tax=Staphylococcus aureus TaxID=1280 RepID=UPI001E56F72B